MRKIVALWTLLVAALAAPAQAEWRRAESPNFIVYSEGPESRLRERVALLEEFDALLRLMTTTSAPPARNKLHVYLVQGSGHLQRIRPVSRAIAGFYTASPYGIAAFVDETAEGNVFEILFHEYGHHFMNQYATGPYPAWYVEGFAEYFSTARFRSREIDIGLASLGQGYSVVNGRWLPMERILGAGPAGLNREDMSSYYAQSWLMTHYFFGDAERQAALRRYLAETARLNDPVAALQAGTGMSPDQLTEALRRYTRRGTIAYRRMSREGPPPEPVMTVTRLPGAADDLILSEAALRVGVTDENRPLELARIRAAAARHEGNPYARRVLAHAEAILGDPSAAHGLLDALIAEASGDAELLYLKGMAHLRAAESADDPAPDMRAARTWFNRAHRLDENHFQTLYRYVESLRGEANFDSENTSNVLLLAHQLAPQVPEIRLNAAALLMARRRFDEAEYVLRPIAGDPHNEELARAAQGLIAAARTEQARPGGIPAEAGATEPAAGGD